MEAYRGDQKVGDCAEHGHTVAMSNHLKAAPKFASEATERKFWRRIDSSNLLEVGYQSLIRVWLAEKLRDN